MNRVCCLYLVAGVLMVNAFIEYKLTSCPICVDENGHIKKPLVYAIDKEQNETAAKKE